jgi:CRISPR system Cascade subunit CasE
MPYLSRVWLNPLRTQTQRMLRDPQVLHAAVLGGLSRQPVRERVLWRVEQEESPYRVDVLVLSESQPSWEHLVEQGGWPSADEPQALVRPYEPLLRRVVPGAQFAFRLRANPVSATRLPDKPSAAQQQSLTSVARSRGVRVPHRTVAHQLAWLTDRVEKWGFEIPETEAGFPDMRLIARKRLVFGRRTGGDGGRRVVIETATYEGRVRVIDEASARRSLLSGVGHARAYGCGLITLAPAAPSAAER